MPVLAFIFVLSGAAGLIYESVWARYVGLLVGHSAYAQVIVLVIFLGGMALGALVVGRWTSRLRSPLLWYAIAETLIGLGAFIFHPVFVGVTRLAYERWLPSLSPGLAVTATTWTLAALLILPQSILLGATFPLMTAGAIRRRPDRSGTWLGLLYFANSFGAAMGALVEGFVLVGAFGLDGTVRVAGVLNLVVAAAVFALFVRPARPEATPARTPAPDKPAKTRPRLELVLLLVSLMTALSSFFYEIAWTRMLSLVHGGATHSFELMLSAFILGLAFGSLWISRRADRTAEPLVLLARLQWAMGIAAIATLPLYVMSFDWTAMMLPRLAHTNEGYQVYSVGRYAITLIIMLPATFCAGTTLPLITKTLLAAGSGERAIGVVYGVNTIGSIIGAGLASLLLIPMIGLKGLLIFGAVIDVAVGAALLIWLDRSTTSSPRFRWATAATAAGFVTLALLSPFSPTRLASGVFRYGAIPDPDVFDYLFYRDGRTASVSVRQWKADTNTLITISTNGKPDASVSPILMRPYDPTSTKLPLDEDMSTQAFLSLLTLAHAPNARVGAVIGQGSGMTSHMVLASPTLTTLHTIEIEPEMIRGSRLFHPANRRVFDDPRSRFETEDARAFLAATGEPFDFVISEPSNPWVSGVATLFTVELYERVRRRLKPGGVFVQWYHLYETDDLTVGSVLASIDRVFPSYRAYMSSNSDLIVIAGASDALPTPDWSVLALPGVREDLRPFLPMSSEAFAAAEVGGRGAFHGCLASATINSDFAPFLDLNAERHRFRNDYATGFIELGRARHDIAAAIEKRRRGFGLPINPTPEIVVAAKLTRANRFRDAWANAALVVPEADTVRRSIERMRVFQKSLVGSAPPADWRPWVDEFIYVEGEIHGGTAGVADESFYGAVQRYLTATRAPLPVQAAVGFHHGLAAWNFDEASRAGIVLIDEMAVGNAVIPPTTLRLGTALAWLQLGYPGAAQKVYDLMSKVELPGTIGDCMLRGLIDQAAAQRAGGRP